MSETQSQITFRRAKHDKQNPYVMISREMLHDKSISPKAKGVLCYLLSLPNDWKIYHTHLMNALDVGKDYLDSAIDELLASGYATRSRERVKGLFQPYQYEISEFKIFIPEREIPLGELNRDEMPPQDSFNQSGLTAAENPHILKKERSSFSPPSHHQKNTTTNTTKEQKSVVVFSSLNNLKISNALKEKISSQNSEESVNLEVKRCLAWSARANDEAGILTCLKKASTWNDTVSKDDKVISNQEYLKSIAQLDGKKIGLTQICIGNTYIEFVCGPKVVNLSIDNVNFKKAVEDYMEYLRRNK